MHNARPGDMVYVQNGALLRSAVDNEEHWNVEIVQAIVVGSARRYVEIDDDIAGLITIFIAEQGLYLVSEDKLMTPDEYLNPQRLFPSARLRDS